MRSKLVEKIVETDQRIHGLTDLREGNIYSFLNPVSYIDALKHRELFGQMDGLFRRGIFDHRAGFFFLQHQDL